MSISVESAVLGCIVQEPHLIATTVSEGISPVSFTDPRNVLIYSKMLELYRDNRPIDGVVLYSELQDDPELALYSTTLADELPYTGNLQEYISVLRDGFIKRKLEHGLSEISARLSTTDGRELLAHAERILSDIAADSYTSTFTRAGTIVDGLVERLEDGTIKAFGISTGFTKLDRITH